MARRHDPEDISRRLKEAGLEPLESYKNAVSKIKCKCLSCGNIVFPRFAQIQQGLSGCKKCAMKKFGAKIKLDDELALSRLKQFGFEALEPYPGSHFKWRCRCLRCGDEVNLKLNLLTSGKSKGCIKCGIEDTTAKNRFSQDQAISRISIKGFVPLEDYKTSHAPWLLRHNSCGSEFRMQLSSITSMDVGCPVCAGKQIRAGFNDLSTTHPEIARELVSHDPKEIGFGSNKKVIWKCSLGHNWSASVASRTGLGSGCPYCANKKVLKGFNDLATINPSLAIQAHDWDPSTVTQGSPSKRNWKCSVGHVWRASVSDRSSGTGCPTCSASGYSSSLSGWVYLLEHEVWGMLQIGITNKPKQRIGKHEKSGWLVLDILGPMDGQVARDFETDALQMLRKRGIVKGRKSNNQGKPFDGYSESWQKTDFNISKLSELFKEIENLRSKSRE